MTGAVPTPARARRAVPRWLLTGCAVLLATALMVATAYAVWLAQDGFRGGSVTAGDLDLVTGEATWQQVTPGVSDPRSGVLGAVPADVVTMPGDVIEIAQPVTTTLTGDNLAAGLTVGFGDAQVAEDIAAGRIAVSYRVEDAEGEQVAPATGQAEIGDTLAVPGLTGTDAGSTTAWVVVVRVDVLGDYVWTDSPVTAAIGLWSADALQVTLEQLRTGGGFVSGAPAATGPTTDRPAPDPLVGGTR